MIPFRKTDFLFLALIAALLIPNANAQADMPSQEAKPNTPIEHFIVLMQENHTFDNYFGTYPGADGIPEGTCMPMDPTDPTSTECIEPFHIGDRSSEDLDNWDLRPLTERDANANSLISAFDFSMTPRKPIFIPFERVVKTEIVEPRRHIIYMAYGGALISVSKR